MWDGGDGVDIGAEDVAVVSDVAEGTLLAGVENVEGSDPKERSGVEVSNDMSSTCVQITCSNDRFA